MDVVKFSQLLEEGKKDEARQLFHDYLVEEPSEEEKGAVLVALASVYMKAKNELNKQHLAELQQAMAILQRINKDEKKLDDEQDLEAARSNLKDL